MTKAIVGHRFFPEPRRGRGPHGIVEFSCDFRVERLLEAYRVGIFPWPSSSEIVPWCSPPERAIFPLEQPVSWSRSLRRSLRKKPFTVTVDRAFREVMLCCADREHGTWIVPELVTAFEQLHQLGWAHSLEVWNHESQQLVGGIYGVAIGGMFAGESMFHRETDASKVAFASLVERLIQARYLLFDVQVRTEHLESLGCMTISRDTYLQRLDAAVRAERAFPTN